MTDNPTTTPILPLPKYASITAHEVAEIDAKLERIETERQRLKAEGRLLMARKRELALIENITLRVLCNTPASAPELAWIDAHPAEWEAIKAATQDARGTRLPQVVKVK